MRNTRVKGHTLDGQGSWPFFSLRCSDLSCAAWQRLRADYELTGTPVEEAGDGPREQFATGHARCSCGWESPHLPSQRQRRIWHSGHKKAVAA